MLKELINKLKNKKQKLAVLSNEVNTKTEETEIANFKIQITNDNNIYKVEISDYISMQDYCDRMDLIDKDNVADLIFMSVLYNSETRGPKSGVYFIFCKDNRIYNILINESEIKVAERTLLGEEKEERIITFPVDGSDYHYFRCKHDKIGSSYATRYFSKNGTLMPKLELTREEFVDDITAIIGRIKEIDSIENIYDVNIISDVILNSYGSGQKQIKKVL